MPQVSFVVPVYNVEPYIHRCIDSILNQTFADFELILVDDGSPDNCGAICDEYAKIDSRIHVIHQENGGLSAARNAGIDWVCSNSDSQWLTFIDSDDWIHKEYLRILLSMAERFNSRIAVCHFVHTTCFEEDKDIGPEISEVLDFRRAYIEQYSMCMAAAGKLYDRKLFEKLRFPEGKLYEDAFISHIPLIESGTICICSNQLYYYYIGNIQSITRCNWSPRRMNQIEAHELRIAHWKKVGYDDCYIREMQVYIEALTDQLRQLRDMNNTEYVEYQKKLQDKLRKSLSASRKVGLYPFEESYWGEYTLAYPQKLQRRLLYLFLRITGK